MTPRWRVWRCANCTPSALLVRLWLMRLISVTLRSYRVHREITVPFDPSRNVIGGPNEAGKSTLAEAIHRVLFLKAKGSGKYHREMSSTTHPGHPEVELAFEAGGASYRLMKRFGASGTATLTASGGQTWQADAAEAKLAELLGINTETGAGSRDWAAQQWSHLWVWQGRAGTAPADFAKDHRDTLLLRLQREGGAAAMQSERDAAVAGKIAELVAAIYTTQGVKANSDLARAIQAESDARQTLERAQASLAKLSQAMQDVQDAELLIDAKTRDQGDHKKELLATEEALLQVASLRTAEQSQVQLFQQADSEHQKLTQIEQVIRDLTAQIQAGSEALAPREAELDAIRQSRSLGEETLKAAEVAHRRAAETVREMRAGYDLALAHQRLFEATARHAALANKLQQAELVRGALKDLQTRLAKLPPLTEKKIKELRTLETALATADAALTGMASGIEVAATDAEVVVGGEPLKAGESKILTESTVVEVGGTRLRIHPGGGSRLAEARQQAGSARMALAGALQEAGVATAQEGAAVLAERQQIQGEAQTHQAKLQGLGGDALEAETAAAEQDFIAAEALMRRKTALVEGFAVPETAGELRLRLQTLEQQLAEAEGFEQVQKHAVERAAAQFNAAGKAAEELRQSLQKKKDALTGFQAQIQLLVSTHGEDQARMEKQAAALTAKTQAEEALATTRRQINALQPQVLEADQKRLQRAITLATQEQSEARTKRAIALSQLQTDGTTDPQADLAMAQAQLRSTETHRLHVERRARALKWLDQSFTEERKLLAEHFTQPLSLKIGAYLERMFGPGVEAKLLLNDAGSFDGFDLIRPAAGAAAHAFEVLSGGAKEQVAAAVRLAMAEVLAEGHDGCLPIVFDDAFAYSDPQRVRTLQRMLDLAAEKGLQVIVLTCNPSDYATLGARTFTLS